LYPPELIPEIEKLWKTRRKSRASKAVLPSKATLSEILDVCFHASLRTEEGRRIHFRIAYCDPGQASNFYKASRKDVALKLSHPRQFSSAELLRLAPAADSKQMLIGVFDSSKLQTPGNASGRLSIWGLIDIGLSWWELTHGESESGYTPPDCFMASSNEPGNITISRQDNVIITLRRGTVIRPMTDVFYTGPVAKFLSTPANKLHTRVCKKLKRKKFDPKDGADENYPQSFYLTYVQRILQHIRERNHGGTILMVPDTLKAGDSRLTDRISIKYQSDDNRAFRYLANYLHMDKQSYDAWDRIGKRTNIPKTLFDKYDNPKYFAEEAEREVRDHARFLASLSSVDGAVVLTQSLRLIGFGAEVIADSPSLTTVRIAEDAAGGKGNAQEIDSFGTRHRAALRFCSSYENSIAFIISQDGDVRVAKRVGPDVIMWSGIDVDYYGET